MTSSGRSTPAADSLLQTLVRLREFSEGLFERSDTEFRAAGIEADFENIRLSPGVRKHLLLLFKEAMNNCLKYAQASRCVFSVANTPDGFQLTLSDDGEGFDLEKTKAGYGLRNMRERAGKISGELGIESEIGRGTVFSLNMKMLQVG